MNHIITETRADFDTSHGFTIKRTQEVTPEFLKDLQDRRDASQGAPMGDFALACSIPVALHETWLRQGFNCITAPIKDTLARLRKENLDAFIATNKSI